MGAPGCALVYGETVDYVPLLRHHSIQRSAPFCEDPTTAQRPTGCDNYSCYEKRTMDTSYGMGVYHVPTYHFVGCFFFFFFSECDGAPWPKVVGIEESAKRSLFFKVVCREYLGHGGLSTLATTIIAVCTTFVSLWVPQFGSLKTLFQKTDLETKSRTINNNYTTLLPDEKSHGGLCMYTTRIIHCRKKMTRFVRFWAVIQKTFPPKHGKTFPPKHGRIT